MCCVTEGHPDKIKGRVIKAEKYKYRGIFKRKYLMIHSIFNFVSHCYHHRKKLKNFAKLSVKKDNIEREHRLF